jgi:hypothetical protein
MNLKLLSDKKLRQLRIDVANEITRRNGNALTRLEGILRGSPYYSGYYNFDFQTALKGLTIYTEKEFSQWHGVGKLVLKTAKEELERVGLTFKTEVDASVEVA